MRTSTTSLLRTRTAADDGKVVFAELFFDLVFVFAITQLSHFLLHDFTVSGGIEAGVIGLAVWWVWIYTTWVTNWLDPQKTPVRLMLYALMLCGLFLSMSIPEAFGGTGGGKGLYFALAFIAMQVGRSLFTLWAFSGRDERGARNFQRITCWLALSGVFWVAGGLADPSVRLGLWLVALAIEYVSPVAGFWVPGLGRSTPKDWDVSGAHMAERCGLFIIICLGETLLISGATFAKLDWTAANLAAFISAFALTVAMWWVYFHFGHERAARHIAASDDPGRVARLAFTYAHIPIVTGIILAAVAAEFVLAHPSGHVARAHAGAIVGGPAVFLAGNLWVKWATAGAPPLSHMAGLALLAGLALAAPALTPLALSAAATMVVIMVAVWERVSLGPSGETHASKTKPQK